MLHHLSSDRKIDSDKFVIQTFNRRNRKDQGAAPQLDPVVAIKEIEGFVYVTIKLEHNNYRHYEALLTTIERMIPASQVTLEVVGSTENKFSTTKIGQMQRLERSLR